MRISKKHLFILPMLLLVVQLHGQPIQQTSVRDTVGYLILTDSAFIEAAEMLSDWKMTMGFKTDIMYVSRSSSSETIENQLGSYYSLHPNTKYLAILGDDDFVKTKNTSIYLNLNPYDSQYHSMVYDQLTDFYYGKLDGDSVPQVHRGRLLVSNETEAKYVVEKIIAYESNPISAGNIYNNGIHVSFYQSTTKNHITHEHYRFVRTSEEIKEALQQIGRTVKRIYSNIPIGIAYWNNDLYCSDTANISEMIGDTLFIMPDSIVIQNSLREGASYILYVDHGDDIGWSHPVFNTSSFPSNLNNKWPVYFNCCCKTGKFSSSNCFAKSILTCPNGGIASISASNISIEGFMSSLFEGIFDGIWPNQGLEPVYGKDIWNVGVPPHTHTPIYRLGDLLDYGLSFMKAQMRNAYAGDSAGTPLTGTEINDFISMNKYMHEIYQLFGDPALEIRTQTPEVVSAPSVCQFTDNILLVKTTDGYSRVVLYDLAQNDVQTFYGTKILYNFDTDNLLRLCIVRSNAKPYIKEYRKSQIDMFIQNEAIDGMHKFIGKEIKVGQDVTDDKMHGNVYFNTHSSTSLSAAKVKLSKGVIIPHGSSIRINKNS